MRPEARRRDGRRSSRGDVRQPVGRARGGRARPRPRSRRPGRRSPSCSGAAPGRGRVHRRRHRGRQPRGEGRRPRRPRGRARATASSRPASSTRAVLASCDRLAARGVPGRAGRRRPRRASSTSTRCRRRARRPHRGRVGDARQQRGRHHPAARRRSPAWCASARRGPCCTPTRCRPCRGSTSARATAGADLVAISAHKFGGPKGTGALVVRGGVPLEPLIEGGGQERGLRSGTSNVAGAVAMAAALRGHRSAARRRRSRASRALRDRLVDGLLAAVPDAFENGDRGRRSPGTRTSASAGVEAEALLVAARPGRRVRGGRLVVLVGRDRAVARARGDGHAPRRRAVVDPAQPRVTRRPTPTSTPRSPSSPTRSRSSAPAGARSVSAAAGARRDERRGRLVGRGRAAARAGPRRHRRHAEALGRRVRLRVLQRLRRRGRPARRRAARHPALRLQLHRRRSTPTSSSRTSTPTRPGARRTRASSATARSSSVACSSARDALGFDFLATGHHARVDATRRRRYVLAPRRRRGEGPVVRALHARPARARRASLFPVGELTKAEVRAHAAALGLRTADKPESMDVCFITRGGRVAVPRRSASPCRRARSSTPAARRSVRTTASRRSRSASGAARGRRSASGATSSTSTRDAATSHHRARATTCCATRSRVRDLTFVDAIPIGARRSHAQVARARRAGRRRARRHDGALRAAAAAGRARPGGRALRRRRAGRRRHRYLTATPHRAVARFDAQRRGPADAHLVVARATAITELDGLHRLAAAASTARGSEQLDLLVEAHRHRARGRRRGGGRGRPARRRARRRPRSADDGARARGGTARGRPG